MTEPTPVPDRAGRLLDDAVTRDVPVVVQVPPGFGGERLLAAWSRSRSRPDLSYATDAPEDLRRLPTHGFRLIVWTAAELPALPERSVLLTAGQLSHTPAEIEALLPPASFSAAPAVSTATAGWPALVASAVQHLREVDPTERGDFLAPLSRQRLRQELDAWLPSSWRATLDWIVVAGGLHPDERREPSPVDQGVVAEATELGILRWTAADRGQTLQVVEPVAVAVLDAAREDRLGHRATLRSVATTRAASGLLDCGLRAAADLEDWELCAQIEDRWCIELVFSPYRTFAEDVLRRLPPTYVRRRPVLALRAETMDLIPPGTTLVPRLRGPEDVQDVLSRDATRDILDRTLLGMWIARTNGNAIAAAQTAERTAELALFCTRAAGGGRELASTWFIQAGLAAQQAGADRAAQTYFRTSIRLAPFDGFGFAAADARAKLAALCALRGEHATARVLLDEIDTAGVIPWVQRHIVIARRVAQHALAVAALAPISAVTETTLLGDPFEFDEMWPTAFWVAARYLISTDRPRDALLLSNDMRRVKSLATRTNGDHPRLLALMDAEAHLRRGHGTQALAALADVPRMDPRAAVLRARVLLLARDDAGAHAEAMLACASDAASPRTRREAELVAATVEALRGQSGDARARVDRVIGETTGERDLWTWTTLPEEWRHCLAAVTERTLPEPTSSPVAPDISLISLTPREQVVLEALSRGLDQAEIARELVVSVNTVKTQLRAIYRKLDVNTRAMAIAKASSLGLLRPG